jgi:hypothetical protein
MIFRISSINERIFATGSRYVFLEVEKEMLKLSIYYDLQKVITS